jgi:hypothetical protein
VTDERIGNEALALLRDHGEIADLRAAMRADSYLAGGDIDEFAFWMKVHAYIKKLTNAPPQGSTQ